MGPFLPYLVPALVFVRESEMLQLMEQPLAVLALQLLDEAAGGAALRSASTRERSGAAGMARRGGVNYGSGYQG